MNVWFTAEKKALGLLYCCIMLICLISACPLRGEKKNQQKVLLPRHLYPMMKCFSLMGVVSSKMTPHTSTAYKGTRFTCGLMRMKMMSPNLNPSNHIIIMKCICIYFGISDIFQLSSNISVHANYMLIWVIHMCYLFFSEFLRNVDSDNTHRPGCILYL